MSRSRRRFGALAARLAVLSLPFHGLWMGAGAASADLLFVDEVRDLGPGAGPALSPDGKQALYYRWSAEGNGVFVADTSGGEPRRIDSIISAQSPFETMVIGQLFAGSWARDGRRFVYVRPAEANPHGVWRFKHDVELVEAAASGITETAVVDRAQHLQAVHGPEGLYWVRWNIRGKRDKEKGFDSEIRARVKGAVRTLRQAEDEHAPYAALAISPDETLLGVRAVNYGSRKSTILLLDAGDGSVKTSLPAESADAVPQIMEPLVFSPDGRYLVFLDVVEPDGRQVMAYRSLEVATGEVATLCEEQGIGEWDFAEEAPKSAVLLLVNPLRHLEADFSRPAGSRLGMLSVGDPERKDPDRGEYRLFSVRGDAVGYMQYRASDRSYHAAVGRRRK